MFSLSQNDWIHEQIVFIDQTKIGVTFAVWRRVLISAEADGAFAVVDVDTLWRTSTGHDFHWIGRAGKVYTLAGGQWKMFFLSRLAGLQQQIIIDGCREHLLRVLLPPGILRNPPL